jgi:hypothetical protein
VYWIHLAQDRYQWQDLVNTNEPSGSVKGGKFLDKLSDCQLYGRTLLHGVSLLEFIKYN